MNNLPEDLLLIIFEYLDNESMWNALMASKYWAKIFSNSSKLSSKFKLQLNPEKVKSLAKLKSLPKVSIKRVSVENFRAENSRFKSDGFSKLSKIIENFKNSIEFFEIKQFDFRTTSDLLKIIKNLTKLQSILLDNCSIESPNKGQLPKFSSLKSIYFHESSDDFFKIFHSQKSVEKVSVVRMQWGYDFSWVDFDEMAKNFKNLNHIVMNGHGTGHYFDHGGFPFQIRKLEAFLMTFWWQERTPRLNFLKSQQGSLKELILEKLPYDHDGGEVLKFMIEEMKLETFYFGKIPLILNGRKQEVKEFRVQEVQIQSAFEMFQQFPSITKFSLFLTQTGLDEEDIGQIVNPRTSLFINVKELEIEDSSNYECLLTMFGGLYRNFRNIHKLTLITADLAVNTVLEECLSEMMQLNEIYLATKVPNSMQRLQFIRDFAPNVKKLSLCEEFVNDAREFFGNEVEIVGI